MRLTVLQRDILGYLDGRPFGWSNEPWWRGSICLGIRKRDGKEINLRVVTLRALSRKGLVALEYNEPTIAITTAGRSALAPSVSQAK